ncbi:Oxidoreductase calM like protein [Verticillium longisporum]|nr:Oxidoreductase calM like protein [Verticillium longisporum]
MSEIEVGESNGKHGRVLLLTGCSSGFGRELVKAATSRGDKVIATARKVRDLDYCSDITNAKVLELDVTAPQSDLDAKIPEAVALFGRIDVKVNNAGYVLSGVWEELNPDQVQAQFDTNLFGPLNLTRAVLPHMRAKNSGMVLFMGRISGWHGIGGGGPYSATKFALEGAVECLAKETKPFGIRVHLLVIGQFRTSILDVTKKKAELDPNRGEECYAPVKADMARIHAATAGTQPGNPVLAAEKIVELATWNHHSGKVIRGKLPLRIPLGSDAVQVMRMKCESTLKDLDQWEVFAQSTDFEDKPAVPAYLR